MYTQEQINEFIKSKIGIDQLNPSDDLFNDHGVSGDDFHELMEEYRKTYNVDMSTYLWYFHTDEEGNNFGGAFFKPPNERVQHIAVTPLLLYDFANKGFWNIQYPDHKLPKRRWDILVNAFLLIIFLAWALYSCLN